LPAVGADTEGDRFVWLIGGGPNIFRSQVQIERNALWVLGAIEGLPGQRRVAVYFTDGADPAPDIHEWTPPADTAEALQPLALVFDDYWSNGLRYRNHRLPGLVGTTEAESLSRDLRAWLRALGSEDQGWLVFIGHGARGEDEGQGALELWSDSTLRVEELRALLDQAPAESRMRFLLTQCYAGAFASLATSDRNRCGFMAAAADQMSEGCSPAIEKTDYEDYSTYFFAALTGRPRDHAGLDGRPDWDADGRVTPLEAHFHVLATAFSADVPRSTSEALLMDWRPGNLDGLLSEVDGTANEYTDLAQEMMRNLGIDPDAEPGKAMYRRQRALLDEWESLEQDEARLRSEIVALQEGLRTEVLRLWPEAKAPYTLGFKRFLQEDLDTAQALIGARPEYPDLQRRQTLYWEQDERALDLRRRQNRLHKIAHLLRLGMLKAAFEREASAELRARYRTLRECESAPF
jgi:hypothetical protein